MPLRSCARLARRVASGPSLFCTLGSISASVVVVTLGSALIFESDMMCLSVVDPNTPRRMIGRLMIDGGGGLGEDASEQQQLPAAFEPQEAAIFSQLDEIITDPNAVLASNTSSIPIMKLGAATKNPGRVLGLHFFNPVPVLPLVELVTTLATSPQAAARTEHFAGSVLGKQVVRCTDRSGFVVNFLLVPYLLSAIRMVESGVATVEDVDTAVVAGLSHPMGPLRLSDLIGLDTLKLIADKMFDEFKEPHYGPPPLLLRMVEAGRLGKKSGQGFYTY
jgi:3-hydroxybutyryl-CoA dehydrogenase